MKNTILNLLLLLITSLVFAQEKTSVLLTGKTHRPVDTLLLLKTTEDPRYQGIEIPVRADSTFEHSIEITDIEEHRIIFKSEFLTYQWRVIIFYPDAELISFELYPMNEGDKNVITGSELTKQRDTYRTEKWQRENDLEGKVDSLDNHLFRWQQEHLSKEPNLLGFYEYYHTLNRAERKELADRDLQKAHDFWLQQYPDHPLAEVVKNLMNVRRSVKVGGNYVDFQAPGVKDEVFRFSDFVGANEYTLLDIWATWCGPCIKKSKKIQESYMAIQQQNVQVVGIVGGIDEYAKFETAKEKYAYPWELYPEVNNQNKIWEKYGLLNAGGGQYLIDNTGKILAVNPDVETILSLTKK